METIMFMNSAPRYRVVIEVPNGNQYPDYMIRECKKGQTAKGGIIIDVKPFNPNLYATDAVGELLLRGIGLLGDIDIPVV